MTRATLRTQRAGERVTFADVSTLLSPFSSSTSASLTEAYGGATEIAMSSASATTRAAHP